MNTRKRKLIQTYLKLDVPNSNFDAYFEGKSEGTRFADVWNDQEKTNSKSEAVKLYDCERPHRSELTAAAATVQRTPNSFFCLAVS